MLSSLLPDIALRLMPTEIFFDYDIFSHLRDRHSSLLLLIDTDVPPLTHEAHRMYFFSL